MLKIRRKKFNDLSGPPYDSPADYNLQAENGKHKLHIVKCWNSFIDASDKMNYSNLYTKIYKYLFVSSIKINLFYF